jgi:glycosyltransferase involved in cell wall biosynthesis
LRQTYAPLEIVVLADGANAASIALLERCGDPRLRWFATPQPSGMIGAWNKVVASARGKYFLYCADDDVLCDHAIDPQIGLLEAHPNVGFCHADFYLIDDAGHTIGEWRSHEGTWVKSRRVEWQRYLSHPRCCMQTCVVRRDLWEQAGGWDESAGYPGDNSLYLKLLRLSDVGHSENFACRYRIRTHIPDSWEKNAQKVRDDFTLAARHLENPPDFCRAFLSRLERNVRNHAARNAIAVLADRRGSTEEIAALAAWVKDRLLVGTGICFFYRIVLRFGMELPAAYLKRVDEFLRGSLRRTAAILRRAMVANQFSVGGAE